MNTLKLQLCSLKSGSAPKMLAGRSLLKHYHICTHVEIQRKNMLAHTFYLVRSQILCLVELVNKK